MFITIRNNVSKLLFRACSLTDCCRVGSRWPTVAICGPDGTPRVVLSD